jgi:organic radical activating enzyme
LKFKTNRVIDRLALPITRMCNRKCPECPARQENGRHVSVDELKWIGKMIGKIGKIEVTGGEPSLHPDFEEISEHIHEWFDCDDIMVLTNGYLFTDESRLPLLLKWDKVYVTWYTNDFAIKYRISTNTEVVNRIEDYLKQNGHHIWVQRMDSHIPKDSTLPWANKCVFGYDENDMIAYHRGQIYGCCTSWQLENRGRGIVLTDNWRDDLKDIDLPCSQCFLGSVATNG